MCFHFSIIEEKIKWVTGEITAESFLQENDIIMRLSYHTNQSDNVIRVAREYISKGLLAESRPYIDERVMESTDLIMTKKLIEKEHRTALPEYFSGVLNPAISLDEELENYVTILQKLDDISFFTPVLLNELQFLGASMQFSIPEQSVKEETSSLVKFLDEKVVKRRPGEAVSPDFIGDKIKVSVVYVSKTGSIDRHLRWLDSCLSRGIDRVYLCARGHNIYLVKMLDRELASDSRWIRISATAKKLPLWRGRKIEFLCVGYSKRDVD